LAGWSTWFVVAIVIDLTNFVPSEYIMPRALVFFLSAAVGMLISTGLRNLYRLVWERKVVVRVVSVWFGSVFAALLWQLFRNYIALLPFGELVDLSQAELNDLLTGLFSRSFPIMLLWSFLYFIIKYSQLFQIEKEKSLRSESLAHEAQLRMLHYQLNPHFLFNTLNAISTLILGMATEQANEMVVKLSKFLRYTLDHSPLEKVTLAHEIDTAKLYLDIEKVRFEDKLRVEIDIESAASQAMVPSMLLQPLIENSIKHAVSKSETGGSIIIRAALENPKLVLEVIDDGPGIPSLDDSGNVISESSGVGLANIQQRLREIYGDNHRLIFSNRDTQGCRVTVTIPYDRE